jgi:hypothetical protein
LPAGLRSSLEMGWFCLRTRGSGIPPGCKHLWLAYPVVVSPAAPKRPPATGCRPSGLDWPSESNGKTSRPPAPARANPSLMQPCPPQLSALHPSPFPFQPSLGVQGSKFDVGCWMLDVGCSLIRWSLSPLVPWSLGPLVPWSVVYGLWSLVLGQWSVVSSLLQRRPVQQKGRHLSRPSASPFSFLFFAPSRLRC